MFQHGVLYPIHPSPGSHQLNVVEGICFLLPHMLEIAFLLCSILFGGEYLLAIELRQAWDGILAPSLGSYLLVWQLINLSLGFIYKNEK